VPPHAKTRSDLNEQVVCRQLNMSCGAGEIQFDDDSYRRELTFPRRQSLEFVAYFGL
jgi:hypothetical protein